MVCNYSHLPKEDAMLIKQPKGPFCQSCGMPLERTEDFGTAENGFKVNDYCHYCFINGAFADPDISMQAMIDKCINILVQQNIMLEGQARALMTEFIPQLKRWQGK